MNTHLQLVRAFHAAAAVAQAEHGAQKHPSDMEIIIHQAWLMDEGSKVFKALQAGDMALILAGLTDLAYAALRALAAQGEEVVERPVLWRNDGFVLSVMQLLSDKINRCADGGAENYSAVYAACAHLASAFLNADFDKAFQKIHACHMANPDAAGYKTPDVDDCLYE